MFTLVSTRSGRQEDLTGGHWGAWRGEGSLGGRQTDKVQIKFSRQTDKVLQKKQKFSLSDYGLDEGALGKLTNKVKGVSLILLESKSFF